MSTTDPTTEVTRLREGVAEIRTMAGDQAARLAGTTARPREIPTLERLAAISRRCTELLGTATP